MELGRAKRYFLYLYQAFVSERRRGLDFTMRDTGLYQQSGHRFFGYSKTDEAHLRQIFESLTYSRNWRLLDVGCGKGVVLKEAARYPFLRIAGIEILPSLVRTARRNMEILGLSERVQCIEADALEFEGYGEYDTFFFFNPFSEEVLREVVGRIIEGGQRQGPLTFIYHNPRFLGVFDEYSGFYIRTRLHDPRKNYDTCILEYDGRNR
ncbi:MAG: methyltransferase domain-containing protein [Eubacteriales bacterium]|nr:methyltransferase domain-containing protein [Eubacteriales bacterium]